MTNYQATIKHHSVSKARVISINGTLRAAKIAASKEFGQEFNDHTIIINQCFENGEKVLVARKFVSDGKWV
jgi:hypothetical protein